MYIIVYIFFKENKSKNPFLSSNFTTSIFEKMATKKRNIGKSQNFKPKTGFVRQSEKCWVKNVLNDQNMKFLEKSMPKMDSLTHFL